MELSCPFCWSVSSTINKLPFHIAHCQARQNTHLLSSLHGSSLRNRGPHTRCPPPAGSMGSQEVREFTQAQGARHLTLVSNAKDAHLQQMIYKKHKNKNFKDVTQLCKSSKVRKVRSHNATLKRWKRKLRFISSRPNTSLRNSSSEHYKTSFNISAAKQSTATSLSHQQKKEPSQNFKYSFQSNETVLDPLEKLDCASSLTKIDPFTSGYEDVLSEEEREKLAIPSGDCSTNLHDDTFNMLTLLEHLQLSNNQFDENLMEAKSEGNKKKKGNSISRRANSRRQYSPFVPGDEEVLSAVEEHLRKSSRQISQQQGYTASISGKDLGESSRRQLFTETDVENGCNASSRQKSQCQGYSVNVSGKNLQGSSRLQLSSISVTAKQHSMSLRSRRQQQESSLSSTHKKKQRESSRQHKTYQQQYSVKIEAHRASSTPRCSSVSETNEKLKIKSPVKEENLIHMKRKRDPCVSDNSTNSPAVSTRTLHTQGTPQSHTQIKRFYGSHCVTFLMSHYPRPSPRLRSYILKNCSRCGMKVFFNNNTTTPDRTPSQARSISLSHSPFVNEEVYSNKSKELEFKGVTNVEPNRMKDIKLNRAEREECNVFKKIELNRLSKVEANMVKEIEIKAMEREDCSIIKKFNPMKKVESHEVTGVVLCSMCYDAYQEMGHYCHHCDRYFVNQSTLLWHWELYFGITTFKCPTCRQRFPDQTQLSDHRLTHAVFHNEDHTKQDMDDTKASFFAYFSPEFKKP